MLVEAYMVNGEFTRGCMPRHAAESFEIVFEVLRDGRIGELQVVPETTVGRCIAGNILGRTLPAPPGDFVMSIDFDLKY